MELFAVVRKLRDPSCTDESAGKIRIEVVAGAAPYRYSLTSPDAKISREWRYQQKSTEQTELVAGRYSLGVTDNDNETITRNFTLVMPDALYIDLGADRKLDPVKDMALDVSGQVPDSIQVSYRWENNFGFSSTAKKINVTESGIYRVFVTKEKDGCVFTDDMIVSGAESQRVAVYPNLISSHENYNISVSLDEPGGVIVKVFNARGIQVHEMKDSGESEFQFITSLKDGGIYLVVIQTPKGIETRKVIVY